jgi:hypothetical protein
MSDRAWRKSSYSDSGGGECVEVAASPRTVRVRDSKRPGGPVLALAAGSWGAFVGGLKRDAESAPGGAVR